MVFSYTALLGEFVTVYGCVCAHLNFFLAWRTTGGQNTFGSGLWKHSEICVHIWH